MMRSSIIENEFAIMWSCRIHFGGSGATQRGKKRAAGKGPTSFLPKGSALPSKLSTSSRLVRAKEQIGGCTVRLICSLAGATCPVSFATNRKSLLPLALS